MKKIGKAILIVLAFIVGAGAVKYGIKEYNYDNTLKSVILKSAVNETFTKIDNAVEKDTSNRTETEKSYDASREMISERLDGVSASNASDKDKGFAAGVFAGQYGRHVITTYNYCKTLGVDISEFSNRYKNIHNDLHLRTEAIFKRSGTSFKEVYKAIEETALPYVKKEVSDMKTVFINETGDSSFTLADSCNYFNHIAREPALMNEVKFSNVAPEPYKILMSN